ncbi:hypothetical protein [Haloferula sargassicola]|uniref:Uncharacterized protein n=1 Tax=Haloferula sargassicola TaxID=490096 RepID=A0ABP9URG5_9BACT
MNDRDIRRTERAVRVQTFGQTRADDFAPGSKALELFAQLDPLFEQLEQARVGQLRGPVSKESVLAALLEDFKAISRTARAIALDDPDFSPAAFRYPEALTETPITTHADALLELFEDQPGDSPEQATAKATLRARFLAFEISSDFVEDLREDRDALTTCNAAKHEDNQEGVESTAAIGQILGKIQTLVSRLDSIMKNKFASQPEVLAAWKSASRVERSPKRKPQDPPAPAPVP